MIKRDATSRWSEFRIGQFRDDDHREDTKDRYSFDF